MGSTSHACMTTITVIVLLFASTTQLVLVGDLAQGHKETRQKRLHFEFEYDQIRLRL